MMKKLVLALLLIISIGGYGQTTDSTDVKLWTGADTEDAAWHLWAKGYHEHVDNNLVEACKYYRLATDIKPDYAEAYYFWGCALSKMAVEQQNKDLFNESIAKFERADKLQPDYGFLYNDWGGTLIDFAKMEKNISKKKNTIETLLLKAYDLPEGGGAYNLTRLYALLKDKKAAFAWFEKMLKLADYKQEAIEREPDFEPLRKDARFTELLDTYLPSYMNEYIERTRTYTPGTVDASLIKTANYWYTKAYKAQQNRDYKLSSDAYEKVTRLTPENPYAYAGWGLSLLEQARTNGTLKEDKAVIEAKMLKAEELKAGSSNYNLACLYALVGDKDKAFEWLEKTLVSNQYATEQVDADTDYDSIRNDARFIAMLKKYKQIYDDYTYSVHPHSKTPFTAQQWVEKGKDAADRLKLVEGEVLFAKAVELNPKYTEAYTEWGLMLSGGKDSIDYTRKDTTLLKRSLLNFEKAASLAPDSGMVYRHWANALRDLIRSSANKKDDILLKEMNDKYQKASELTNDNQLQTAIYCDWGYALYMIGEQQKDEHLYRESISKYQKAFELSDHSALIQYYCAYTIQQLGVLKQDKQILQESIALYKSIAEKTAPTPYFNIYQNWGSAMIDYAVLNKSIEADKKEIEKKLVYAEKTGEGSYYLASLYALSGEKDKAFEWLKKALSETLLYRGNMEKDINLTSLRNDTRYTALLNRYVHNSDIGYDGAYYMVFSYTADEWCYAAKTASSDESLEVAVLYYQKAIEADATYTKAYTGLAMSMWKLATIRNTQEQSKDQVVTYLNKAEELKPGAGSYGLASLYASLGDNDKAFYWIGKTLGYDIDLASHIKDDAYFDNVRTDERYIALMAKYKGVWETDIRTEDKTPFTAQQWLEKAKQSYGYNEKTRLLYQKANEMNPNSPDVYLSWVRSVTNEAWSNPSNITLVNEALQTIQKAIALSPDSAELYINWGGALNALAKGTKDDSINEEAFRKYEKAIALGKDNKNIVQGAYFAWGLDLNDLAIEKQDAVLFEEGQEKLQIAADFDPDDHFIEFLKAKKLQAFGYLKKDRNMIKESIAKYAQITDPNINVYTSWGSALLDLAVLDNTVKKDKKIIEEKLLKGGSTLYGSTLFENSGSSYYLASLYALLGKKDKAFDYFRESVKQIDKKRDEIEKDANLASLRSDKRYLTILDTYQSVADQQDSTEVYKSFTADDWINAGFSATQYESFELGVLYYQKAIEADPTSAKAYSSLAIALWNLSTIRNTQEQNRDQVEAYLNKAEELKPGAGSYGLACLYASLGDKEKALDSLEKALSTKEYDDYQDQTTDQLNLYTIVNDEQYKALLEKYAHGSSWNDTNEAYDAFVTAYDYYTTKRYAEAYTNLSKAIELGIENYYNVYYYWGVALAEEAQQELDETLFEASVEKFALQEQSNPDFVSNYIFWAANLQALAEMKDSVEAYKDRIINIYMKAEDIQPGSATYGLALLYIAVDDTDNAAKWLQKTIDTYKSDTEDNSCMSCLASAYVAMARIKKEDDLFKKSIQLYEKLAKTDEQNTDIYNNLAYTIFERARVRNTIVKDKKQIVDKLLKAESIKTGSGSYNLACLYSMVGEKEEAFKWFEKMLQTGGYSRTKITADTDFDNIRQDERYSELLDIYLPIQNK